MFQLCRIWTGSLDSYDRTWWYTPMTPALGKLRHGRTWATGWPGLPSKTLSHKNQNQKRKGKKRGRRERKKRSFWILETSQMGPVAQPCHPSWGVEVWKPESRVCELPWRTEDFLLLLHSCLINLFLNMSSLRSASLSLYWFQEDPALIRWTYARSTNIYPNFRPTPKNSLLGALAAFGPLIFWYYVFKTDRVSIRPRCLTLVWEAPLGASCIAPKLLPPE